MLLVIVVPPVGLHDPFAQRHHVNRRLTGIPERMEKLHAGDVRDGAPLIVRFQGSPEQLVLRDRLPATELSAADCEHNRAAARPVLTLPTTDFVSWD